MRRTLLGVLLLLWAAVSVAAEPSVAPAPLEPQAEQSLIFPPITEAPPFSPIVADDQQAQRCCKVCRKGKACGDSCINRNYKCTKPPGCACDGN